MVAWLVRLSPVMRMMLKVAHLATEWDTIAFQRAVLGETTTADMKEAECNLLVPVKK